ncbi:SMI1/KNR4 family protein, partial [Streptomyces sp. URMC 126]|uniref:SMI1/KNR4 family protein n=1 Tax=Streptomyces sp. URMC 126 TaxID=3423401 RepID=UPI003F1C5CB4
MNASIAHLIQSVPPPQSAQPKEWHRVEAQMGTALPTDYKQLVDTYGGGVFDDAIWLLEPWCPNEFYDLITENEDRPDILAQLWALGEPKPAVLEEDGNRVVAWALTENGDYLYWLVRPGQDPDEWTVMVKEGRGPLWESHPMGCAQFIEAALLTGSAQSEIFGDYPLDEHQFRSSESFL